MPVSRRPASDGCADEPSALLRHLYRWRAGVARLVSGGPTASPLPDPGPGQEPGPVTPGRAA